MPTFIMHAGQMPPIAVGGTGFPQCGQNRSSAITRSTVYKGKIPQRLQEQVGRATPCAPPDCSPTRDFQLLKVCRHYSEAPPYPLSLRQRPEQITQFILHFLRPRDSIAN